MRIYKRYNEDKRSKVLLLPSAHWISYDDFIRIANIQDGCTLMARNAFSNGVLIRTFDLVQVDGVVLMHQWDGMNPLSGLVYLSSTQDYQTLVDGYCADPSWRLVSREPRLHQP